MVGDCWLVFWATTAVRMVHTSVALYVDSSTDQMWRHNCWKPRQKKARKRVRKRTHTSPNIDIVQNICVRSPKDYVGEWAFRWSYVDVGDVLFSLTTSYSIEIYRLDFSRDNSTTFIHHTTRWPRLETSDCVLPSWRQRINEAYRTWFMELVYRYLGFPRTNLSFTLTLTPPTVSSNVCIGTGNYNTSNNSSNVCIGTLRQMAVPTQYVTQTFYSRRFTHLSCSYSLTHDYIKTLALRWQWGVHGRRSSFLLSYVMSQSSHK